MAAGASLVSVNSPTSNQSGALSPLIAASPSTGPQPHCEASLADPGSEQAVITATATAAIPKPDRIEALPQRADASMTPLALQSREPSQ